jgi:hypothetical protein
MDGGDNSERGWIGNLCMTMQIFYSDYYIYIWNGES